MCVEVCRRWLHLKAGRRWEYKVTRKHGKELSWLRHTNKTITADLHVHVLDEALLGGVHTFIICVSKLVMSQFQAVSMTLVEFGLVIFLFSVPVALLERQSCLLTLRFIHVAILMLCGTYMLMFCIALLNTSRCNAIHQRAPGNLLPLVQ